MMRFFLNRKGQTLIEMMMALGVLLIGLLGVTTLLTNSLGYMEFVTEEYTATYLAAEGVELMHNMINENLRQNQSWRRGIPAGNYEMDYRWTFDIKTTPCAQTVPVATGQHLRYDPTSRTYSYGSGDETPYVRTIIVSYEDVTDGNGNVKTGGDGRELYQDIMKVVSRVEWRGLGGGSRDLHMEAHYYNWQNSFHPNPVNPLSSC